jgi:fructose-specific PTS system IIA-like component
MARKNQRLRIFPLLTPPETREIPSMSRKISFTCTLPNGIHARPASAMEETARRFESEISLANPRTGISADAKSILSIIGADIRHGDTCSLLIHGTDEAPASLALSVFLRDTLPHSDDTPQPEIHAEIHAKLPPCLRDAGVMVRYGTPVVPGIGRGRVIRVGGFHIPPAIATDGVSDIAAEQARMEEALQRVVDYYEIRLGVPATRTETELLHAHLAIAHDPAVRRHLLNAIARHKRTAAGAIADTEAHFAAMLASGGSALLRERALDLQDICIHLLRQLYGDAAAMTDIHLNQDSVVVADTLTPGQFLALDRTYLKGLVLSQTGPTSHTVILARSFGIPTLTDVQDLAGVRIAGEDAVADADIGALVFQLTPAADRYYAMEHNRLAARQARHRRFALSPATTKDGHHIEVAANISSAAEAPAVFEAGAEGIGVFRTEMLYLDRDSAPGEEEQFDAYRSVLEAAGKRPVIIRTLDIGGDKPISYVSLATGENPFLGYRGARIYPEFEPLFRTQVRALIRASSHGNLKIMTPMISTLDEVRWINTVISSEQARCKAEGIPFDPDMHIGAMIEVPAAAFAIDDLSKELDFFSIGSNDLLQYFIAADRADPSVSALYNPLHPSFLRLLKLTADAARANGRWLGICGEMGGQTHCLPLLVGLGLDEISAAGPSVPAVKAELARLSRTECQKLLQSALRCETPDAVQALLHQFASENSIPLTTPDSTLFDVDATSKEEAIKQAVDLLYALGRTDDPRGLEAAVWRREENYSTGFGHGFAVPHCQSDTVRANTLAVLRLRQPVPWKSLDDKPVRVVILLALREADAATEHMHIFANIARAILCEEFRAHFEQAPDPAELCAFLQEHLQISRPSD